MTSAQYMFLFYFIYRNKQTPRLFFVFIWTFQKASSSLTQTNSFRLPCPHLASCVWIIPEHLIGWQEMGQLAVGGHHSFWLIPWTDSPFGGHLVLFIFRHLVKCSMPASYCTQPGRMIHSLDLASAPCLRGTTRQRLTNANKPPPRGPPWKKITLVEW